MKSKATNLEIKDVNQGSGIVTIAISSFNNRDSYDDIVRKGAFLKTFSERGKRQNHFLDHDLSIRSLVGVPLKMYETNEHAVIESKLNLDKENAKNLFSDYKFFAENNRTLEHSFMYETVKTNKNNEIKGEDIAEVKMYEYSTVALGANEKTPLLDLKSFKDLPSLIYELENRLRKCNYTDERGKHIEKIINILKQYSIDEPDLTTLKCFEPLQNTPKSLFKGIKLIDNN